MNSTSTIIIHVLKYYEGFGENGYKKKEKDLFMLC